jgi:hypothetical protein
MYFRSADVGWSAAIFKEVKSTIRLNFLKKTQMERTTRLEGLGAGKAHFVPICAQTGSLTRP